MAREKVVDMGLGDFRQVGIVVKDTEKVLRYYEETLGLGHFDTATMEADTDRGRAKLKISFAEVGGIQYELVEPLDNITLHSDFLRQGREGLHHLGFYVKDIDGKIKELRAKGIGLLERGKILGRSYAYLDTAKVSGVIFELIKI